jgi:hypothetical protein
MKTKESEKIGAIIGILAACTTLAISPGYSYDAFSAIKLLFISGLGAVSGFFVFRNIKYLNQRFGRIPTVIIIALLFNAFIILAMSKIDISQAFYGVSGRYTGFFDLLVTLPSPNSNSYIF